MPRHPPCALSRLVVYFKNFRFEATSSVQFLLALKLNILVCLVFSISSVVKERKFATEPLFFLRVFSRIA